MIHEELKQFMSVHLAEGKVPFWYYDRPNSYTLESLLGSNGAVAKNSKIWRDIVGDFANPKRHTTPELAKVAKSIADTLLKEQDQRDAARKEVAAKLAKFLDSDGKHFKQP